MAPKKGMELAIAALDDGIPVRLESRERATVTRIHSATRLEQYTDRYTCTSAPVNSRSLAHNPPSLTDRPPPVTFMQS